MSEAQTPRKPGAALRDIRPEKVMLTADLTPILMDLGWANSRELKRGHPQFQLLLGSTICTYICIYIYMYVYVYVCMCVSMYVYNAKTGLDSGVGIIEISGMAACHPEQAKVRLGMGRQLRHLSLGCC